MKVENDRTAFNMAVWDKLVSDPLMASLPFRIETDEHGQIIMSPPAAPSHGARQGEITGLLRESERGGKVIVECPVSTSKGVKTADVAWASTEAWKSAQGFSCFPRAPELCIEILSPSNTTSEIQEKKRLYFEAGAVEVWLCGEDGSIRFFARSAPGESLPSSTLFPGFPSTIV